MNNEVDISPANVELHANCIDTPKRTGELLRALQARVAELERAVERKNRMLNVAGAILRLSGRVLDSIDCSNAIAYTGTEPTKAEVEK